MGLYSTIMDQITFYTGLSPTEFFTILTIMVFVYRTVSAMFVSPEDYNKPPVVSLKTNIRFDDPKPTPEPVQLGQITEPELRPYNGSDPSKPILMAIKGQIYDVSTASVDVDVMSSNLGNNFFRLQGNFYGPGSPYAMFTGKECSRALALLSFKPEDINGNLEDLDEPELAVLEDWEYKFMEKYPKVGQLVPEKRIQQNEHKEEIEDNLNLDEGKD